MRALLGRRCGLVREGNPCRCDRLVGVSEQRGLLDRSCPVFARHPGVALPLTVQTIEAAARALDLGVAVGEVYRADPTFVPPRRLWERLETALPHLLGAMR